MVAVHVVDADAPEVVTVQVGEPPFLKCGLAAVADGATKKLSRRIDERIASTRRMAESLHEGVM